MTSAAPNLSQLADRKNPDRWYVTGFAVVALIVAARLLLHLLTSNRYGIFRDELYYIACSRHLDWGYVDMPPFIPALTWLVTSLFGSSLFVIRLIPAIAGCGAIALTGYQAYQFGGHRFGDGASGFGDGGFTGVRDQRPPARHQRLRGPLLDGLRLRRHPHHPDRQSEAVAVVRCAGGHRSRKQVFDGRVRPGYRRRIAVHAGAQGLHPQVDLDCWRDRLSDFSAQPAVECPSRLAVRAVDAQHPRQRSGRRSESRPIPVAADPHGEPLRAPAVAGRTGLAVLWPRREALSRSWLRILGHVRGLHGSARQGLLRRSGVSHALRGGRRGLRRMD